MIFINANVEKGSEIRRITRNIRKNAMENKIYDDAYECWKDQEALKLFCQKHKIKEKDMYDD